MDPIKYNYIEMKYEKRSTASTQALDTCCSKYIKLGTSDNQTGHLSDPPAENNPLKADNPKMKLQYCNSV